MSEQFGNVVTNDPVELDFNTFNSDGASVTATIVLGDIKIYKDGGTTARTSTNGIVLSVDHATHTGTHQITVDTSENTYLAFILLALITKSRRLQ